MKLPSLEPLDSFALLGPGFSDGAPLLLTALHPDARSPQLVYAPYESSGANPRRYRGDIASISLELEPEAAAPASYILDDSGYAGHIDDIREAIANGDVYQVNFALRARLAPRPGAALAQTLCRRGLPRYFAWVRLPEGDEFVSASPECFFSIDGDRVRCEPMKGTAAPEREAFLAGSAKDRAELAMITDLMRNDLIPVCQPRSVRVVCERRFIHLPYALQAVSDIEGILAAGLGPLEVLAALHPGGSVTGAPKRMAMQKIAALESGPRGAYCGSLGYIHGERARFSILIRTAEKVVNGWRYGVGGGVVWQSNAADELREIELKLGALR